MSAAEGLVVRSFVASTDAPGRARRWVGSVVPADVREAVTLAVSELVTNALTHGRLSDGETIEVGVLPDRERVRVRVVAPGKAFAAVPAPSASATGGWGLRLVESVTRSWGVEQDGPRTVVWFEV